MWEMKDVFEARGSSSTQPLKLFVDYRKEILVDASDPSKVYAKVVTVGSCGHVEPTPLGKAC